MSVKSLVSGYQGIFNPGVAAVIANGQQESGALSTGGLALCGIMIPAAFTGTTITLEMCDTVGGTYIPVCGSDGNPLSYTVGVSKFLAIDPSLLQGIPFLKIKSGSSEGAARTLTCMLKGF